MTVYINHDRFSTTLYNKRDSFSFDIVNFPHMCSNIPSKPAYGVYISQLIRIGRICEDFSAFAERNYKLTSRLIKQGFHKKTYMRIVPCDFSSCVQLLHSCYQSDLFVS